MYVPINLNIFLAAFEGTIAGIGASNRTPVDPTPADDDPITAVAFAFAQSFDQVWNNAAAANSYQIDAVSSTCEAYWSNRPQPLANATFTNPATYTVYCRGLKAIIDSGSNTLTAQGITPPSPGGNGGVTSSFVYAPGGVAGDNVYTTWASLWAAVAATKGDKVIDIQGTQYQAFVIPAGTYSTDGCVTFTSSTSCSIQCADGCIFDIQKVTFDSIGTVAPLGGPIFRVTNGKYTIIAFINSSTLDCTLGGQFASVTNGGSLLLNAFDSTLNGGGFTVVSVDATGFVIINLLSFSQLDANSIVFTPGGTVIVEYDGSSFAVQPQPAGVTFGLLAQPVGSANIGSTLFVKQTTTAINITYPLPAAVAAQAVFAASVNVALPNGLVIAAIVPKNNGSVDVLLTNTENVDVTTAPNTELLISRVA
jgi:hypothetical protein